MIADLNTLQSRFAQFCWLSGKQHLPRPVSYDQSQYGRKTAIHIFLAGCEWRRLFYFAMDAFMRRCVQMGIKRVLFATRDGHVAKEVFKRIATQRGATFDIQDLDISRAVLNLLQCQSLGHLSRYVAMRVVRGNKGQPAGFAGLPDWGKAARVCSPNYQAAPSGWIPSCFLSPCTIDRLGSYLMTLEALWHLIAPQVTRAGRSGNSVCTVAQHR